MMSLPGLPDKSANFRTRALDEYEKNRDLYLRVEYAAKTILEYRLLPLRLKAKAGYERIEVRSRVKSFESAFNKMRARIAERSSPGEPVADDLSKWPRDMVGVKVRAFPNERVSEVEQIVRDVFQPKPEDADHDDAIGMRKFFVRLPQPCPPELSDFEFEVQIKPYLIDAYHDIEHGLLYKSRNQSLNKLMEPWDKRVIDALVDFEREYAQANKDAALLKDHAKPGGETDG